MEGEGEYGIPRGIPTFSDGRKIERKIREIIRKEETLLLLFCPSSLNSISLTKKNTLNFGTHLLHGAAHCILKRLPYEDQAGKH